MKPLSWPSSMTFFQLSRYQAKRDFATKGYMMRALCPLMCKVCKDLLIVAVLDCLISMSDIVGCMESIVLSHRREMHCRDESLIYKFIFATYQFSVRCRLAFASVSLLHSPSLYHFR